MFITIFWLCRCGNREHAEVQGRKYLGTRLPNAQIRSALAVLAMCATSLKTIRTGDTVAPVVDRLSTRNSTTGMSRSPIFCKEDVYEARRKFSRKARLLILSR
jgi:hypothetical protein